MATNRKCLLTSSAALLMSLSACGGGGGNANVASTPIPTPTPSQTSSAVIIFQSPATQEFVAIGSGDDLRIRYDAATNKYEVMAGNLGWKLLADDPNSSPAPGEPNTNFVFGSQTTFLIRAHYSYSNPDVRYQYSNLAAWQDGLLSGHVAFGIATPAGGVPATGSATYNGMIEGVSTEKFSSPWDYGDGGGGIAGSIKLAFNFAGGTLSGSITPTLNLGATYQLGTLNFINTVFSAGSTNFSGRFDTPTLGANSFEGLFTGPAAQETIGAFAFPYISPVDGLVQHAEGAFIAKR